MCTSARAASGRTAVACASWPRCPLALAIQLLLAGGVAQAADIEAQLAPGDGFVVNSQGGVIRLRVDDQGRVLIPALPASLVEEQFLCFDTASGQLGRCPAIPAGATGPTGPVVHVDRARFR